MLLFIEGIKFLGFTHRRFNTSHVTLYPLTGLIAFRKSLFQYISCYSLSPQDIGKDDTGIWFQYISCYSLSLCLHIFPIHISVSIHLMLLFIALHDLVSLAGRHVSIHLMLLFISSRVRNKRGLYAFQYISCYSLSEKDQPEGIAGRLVSIHLMLLFIRYIKFMGLEEDVFQYISCYSLSVPSSITSYSLSDVSIHLMLLFIWIIRRAIAPIVRFNTSHVTLYHRGRRESVTGLPFQYISCYSLSQSGEAHINATCVSIHLMLLFIGVLSLQ